MEIAQFYNHAAKVRLFSRGSSHLMNCMGHASWRHRFSVLLHSLAEQQDSRCLRISMQGIQGEGGGTMRGTVVCKDTLRHRSNNISLEKQIPRGQ